MSVRVPTFKLNNGYTVPAIGLGTWQANEGVVDEAVRTAIDTGYRHIDTAMIYANEKEIGNAVRAKISEGVVSRSDMFITTKLWNTYHSPTDVVPTCKKSLENLNLDYIDLYLVHWPLAYKRDSVMAAPVTEGLNWFCEPVDSSEEDSIPIEETWKAMEQCVKLGLTRSIGLSNFNSEQVERIMKVAEIKPVVNQVECHPYLNQKKLTAFCKERSIVMTAYAPLGSPSRPWASPDTPELLQDPRLLSFAEKYKKTPAQIILRYLFQLGVSTIPKSSNPVRLKENIDTFSKTFTLSEADMITMDAFDNNGRSFPFTGAKTHKDYPFNIPF